MCPQLARTLNGWVLSMRVAMLAIPPVSVDRGPNFIEHSARHFLKEARVGPIPFGSCRDHGISAGDGVALHQKIAKVALDIIATRAVGEAEVFPLADDAKVFGLFHS